MAEGLASIRSSDDKIEIINQLLLPHTTEWLSIDSIAQAHDAIKTMKVRTLRLHIPASAESERSSLFYLFIFLLAGGGRSGARQPSRLSLLSASRSTWLGLCGPTTTLHQNSSPRPNLSRRTSPRSSISCSPRVRRPSTSAPPRAASRARSDRP